MKVKYETNIDTVAIQLDFNRGLEQRNKFSLIYNWIIGRRLGKLEKNKVKSNNRVNVYDLMSGKSKIATLTTGFSKNFYIRIRWCGLKSFVPNKDEASFSSLMTICALLNTTNSKYRFTELDIALDIFCPFSKILVSCIKPVNNVPYNYVGFSNYYKGTPTSYIEDYADIFTRNQAMKRSYLYDKSEKEDLNHFVSRFEIKLQNRYFLRYGFNFESIANSLNKYAVFYFDNRLDKEYIVKGLNSKKSLDLSDVLFLEKNYKRVYPNINNINEFIREVKSVYVDFFGDVKVFSMSDDKFKKNKNY